MEREKAFSQDRGFRSMAIAYYAVMLIAFVIGLYGLLSLFWLANDEIQHSVRFVGSLFY